MCFYFDLLFNLQHFSIKKIKVNNKIKLSSESKSFFCICYKIYLQKNKIMLIYMGLKQLIFKFKN